MSSRRPVLVVVGSARSDDSGMLEAAEELGREAIAAGFRVATGGLGGVMEAASRGARLAESWSEGDVVGVLPSYDRDTANPFVDVVIPTGVQVARNVVLVAMADVVIAVAGGAGTLSEIAIAWQLGRPVGALTAHGGWAARVAGEGMDHRGEQVVEPLDSPKAAIAWARGVAGTTGSAAGAIGSGWRRGS